ncbi:MAG: biotin/lipoyl-containing protein [Planctomycetaceae bacterium]
MPTEIKVPSVGESISEVFIGEWYVSEGDWVDVDQNLAGLETDKATFDVPAPAAGTVKRIIKKAGETASIGELIAEMEASPKPVGAKPAGGGDNAPKAASAADPAGSAANSGTIVMPAAARELDAAGLKASQVQASGPGGRLLKEDVQRHLSAKQAGGASSTGISRIPAAPAESATRSGFPCPPCGRLSPAAWSKHSRTPRC